jgi:class 3 adenylate cyclase
MCLLCTDPGVIAAYDGDRVMAVFIGNAKNTSAVRCGLMIKAAVREVINPGITNQYDSDFELKQVVGIDTSELLVARTGIRGANDLVWVGRAATTQPSLAVSANSLMRHSSARQSMTT